MERGDRVLGDNTVRFINIEPRALFDHAFDIYVYTTGYLSYYLSPDTPLSDVAAGIINETTSDLQDIQLSDQIGGPIIDGNPPISIAYMYTDRLYGDTSAIRTITIDQNNVYDFLYQARPESFSEAIPIMNEILASFRTS
ncbi:hypothetical protein Ngar_c22340 [Candidatus Nitrososphaera gargensis Ga9.2]|uniref:Uncharacterized protein n=1 Tax=Nitrososphaera gargensis (strain Ga9.2) TaxID=1237085 RepID=K0IND1_NITGG|nr:hypothetical protein [Candidatus Nitrososphaera gargensis]AFU59164.1 hypothetical protein Ngar_c22340 [Candidatus Nitrososphaera gargensis Ga9.2]